ncbi:hypothetical protein HBH51_071400 [Parastagonospora nodorum]|nr:hypothetical protein HBH51_071400 [Parastagonospora nodorum]
MNLTAQQRNSVPRCIRQCVRQGQADGRRQGAYAYCNQAQASGRRTESGDRCGFGFHTFHEQARRYYYQPCRDQDQDNVNVSSEVGDASPAANRQAPIVAITPRLMGAAYSG